MPAARSTTAEITPDHCSMVRRLISLVILLAVTLPWIQGCTAPGDENNGDISGVVRAEGGTPVEGAIVRFQTTQIHTATTAEGQFRLAVPETDGPMTMTAWAPGYFNGGPVLAYPGDTNIVIELHPHGATDNPNYEWLPVQGQPGPGENQACAACHSTTGTSLPFSLPVDEWLQDAHATSAENPRFTSMYLGTDLDGNRSEATRFASKKDYGAEPLKPDMAAPYYGPGYKLDFPDTAGNCATCHLPTAALKAPYDTDPTTAKGADQTGITCDFCHKVWDVRLDPHSGLPNQNMPGVLSYEFRRPEDGQQFFAGPYDDVAPGEDSYSPLQNQSQFCAPCHYGVFWDVPIYNSFGEWLASPYSDPSTGQTCQDCHMPHLGADHFAIPEQGGLRRDPDSIYSHLMPGAKDDALLQNSIAMTVTAELDGETLLVQVKLTNDQAGHHVPTDSPLRHLILLVEVVDSLGRALVYENGPRLPEWCGNEPNLDGHYGGEPGTVYARVLAEQWTNTSPTGAYWNPVYLVSDNRIPAASSDITHYSFTARQGSPFSVHVRLLYRRAFIELAAQKGWQNPDILMEESIIEID